MFDALQLLGKRLSREDDVGAVTGEPRKSHLLHVLDRRSKKTFLIDSGAEVSVLPATKNDRSTEDEDSALRAANGTRMRTYGEKLLSLDIGFRRDIVWPFIVADVNYPIIGADLLCHFNLTINLKKRTILDNTTGLSITVPSSYKPSITIAAAREGFHQELLRKYPSLTKEYESLPPVKHEHVHRIPTTGGPTFVRPRKLNPHMLKIAKECFSRMLKEGIIRPSSGPYAAPLHMVPKTKGWRPVGDYRSLNRTCIRDTYPLPYLHDFSLQLHNKKIFSRLDLKDAFYQLPIAEEDIPKTCVTTPFGAYEFVRMNFGLSGAAQSFQRFIDNVLRDVYVNRADGSSRKLTIFAYVDDILLASDNIGDHEEDMQALFSRLQEYNLRLNIHKCEFSVNNLDFLGHHICSTGIAPVKAKVSAIKEFPLPTTYKELRRFLGMINFYHRFIQRAAELLAPLNNLLAGYKKSSRHQKIKWNEETTKAFSDAKNALANATNLQFPAAGEELAIFTDASDIAVAGVLQQFRNNSWVPLGFFSRKLEKREQLLSVFGRELLAIYLTLKHFHYWVEGVKINVYTDHKSIIDALEKPLDRPIAKEARQLSYIASFNPNVRHIKGTDNVVADALSRGDGEAGGTQRINSVRRFQYEDREILVSSQQQDEELANMLSGKTKSSLNLQKQDGIYADFQPHSVRPYIPVNLRKKFFDAVHKLSHPGVKRSQNLMSEKFVWPFMKKDIQKWVNECQQCQTSKIFKHNKAAISNIPNNAPKFSSIHLDLVGPLPPNKGHQYILTIIDRFTRWPEAVPLPDCRTQTVVD
ncbi:MAG: reverse transcriptase domain-containing protein, partial [Bacteroidota bacterium]